MTLLSTKILTAAQQELVLNTGLGLVHYNALTVKLIALQLPIAYSQNLIITSSNAVHALDKFDKETARIYCVGSKTAHVILSLGFKVVHTAQNSQDLAFYIIKNHSIASSYTYLCGEDRRNELPEALIASKIEFTEVKVYRTTMVERAYKRNFAAVLCYSPRGVYAFAKANPTQANCAICIGETTATAARAFFSIVHTAKIPTIENTIITAYKALQND